MREKQRTAHLPRPRLRLPGAASSKVSAAASAAAAAADAALAALLQRCARGADAHAGDKHGRELAAAVRTCRRRRRAECATPLRRAPHSTLPLRRRLWTLEQRLRGVASASRRLLLLQHYLLRRCGRRAGDGSVAGGASDAWPLPWLLPPLMLTCSRPGGVGTAFLAHDAGARNAAWRPCSRVGRSARLPAAVASARFAIPQRSRRRHREACVPCCHRRGACTK